jgi:hypothetical protein
MRRALFAIASVGMATAVGIEAANAQYSSGPPVYTPRPAYGPAPTYAPPYAPGGPGYGYGPGPYPDAVIVNPVTGRWCRTEPSGYQFCWTP